MKRLVAGFCGGMGILLLFPVWSGAQWVQIGGPEGGDIQALLVSGTNLFAGTQKSVFLSTNNGINWTAVNSGLPEDAWLDFLFASGDFLFAGNGSGGVWRLPLSEIESRR